MKKTMLAFLPVLTAGHFNSTVEFAKHLLQHPAAVGRLSATFLLSPSSATAFKSLLPSTKSNISVHFLPDIDVPKLDATDGVEEYLSLSYQLYSPHVKSALAAVSAAALIIDIFATPVIDAAKDLGIPVYVFFTTNAAILAFMLRLPHLNEETPEEFEHFRGTIKVPGLSPIPPMSMPGSFMKKKSRCYTWMISHGQRFKELRGVLCNTFWELEHRVLSVLESDRYAPPVHSIGPVIWPAPHTGGDERHECLQWLDTQPKASVVFLCFGSMGRMTSAQAAEAAMGLERSGQRFLWFIRLTQREGEELPLGFRERTSGRGMVLEGWAPQLEVLGHAAVGGFVTHGGWNSCLESLWNGIPMAVWPMYAEQHLNAFLMATDMGVAMEMKMDRQRGGWVTAQEVERNVRGLMGESAEGRKVKERVTEMKEASRAAVQIGGSSWDAMGTLVGDLLGVGD